MNTVALILAAGEAERMSGFVKQLLPIGDTTILGRMLAQLEQRGIPADVVTHREEIALWLNKSSHNPVIRDTLCDTLLSTVWLWEDRTIVLLGDVVYSSAVMDEIVNCDDSIRVFGTTWEIFAVVFTKKNHSSIVNTLRRASTHRRGKLRCFYRAYCGFDLDCQEKESKPLEDKVFYYTRDWTRDIDSPYEYDRLMTEVVDKGLLNDEHDT